MRRLIRCSKVFFAVAIIAAIAVGTVSMAKKPPKPPVPCQPWLMCPDVWDPVICNDGNIYSNQCYADRMCAKGCKPYGPGPVPL
jgi:hypothetical protein